MSNLSDLLPAGAGGKQVDFVASGTLSSGQTVVLNSDGTVSAVAETTEGVGTAVVFNNASTFFGNSGTDAVYDSNANKIVIVYRDNGNSDYGTAIVGTVSGTSISFGTPAVFANSLTAETSTAFDSNSNKIVIAYRDAGNSNYGTAIVGTVSGTSISFGSAVVFESARSDEMSVAFDSNSNKVVIAYQDAGNSDYGTAIVGTVSGTSISFGTAVVFESASTNNISAIFDPNANKVVIAYRDGGNSNYGTTIVGTVSGTSISFGSSVVFESDNSFFIFALFDSANNKIVICYADGGNASYGTAIIGTVSGTSISFGSSVVFASAGISYISAAFDSNANKVVIAYRDNDNSYYGTTVIGTVNGTSISFSSPTVFENATSNTISATFDSSAKKVVIAYRDAGNLGYGTAVVFQNQSSNNTDFIGITDAAISDTATGSVTIKGGISTNVTGLTPNATYYVQADGSLSTTASSVLAGKALSSTSINLDYTT